MTYSEYLKSLGATDEDVKVLDHPLARKAWEAQQAEAARITAESAKFKADKDAYDKWYRDEAIPTNVQLQKERDSAVMESKANAARIKALQEAGLIELAEQNEPGSTKTKDGETPAFDPEKYVSREVLLQVADKEGDAIATFADIQDEHRELFGTRINARELRAEAKAQRKTVEQVWMEKYGVAAKRTEVAAAKSKAHDDAMRAEGAKAKETELADKYGSPLTRPAVPSSTPFTDRVPSAAKAEENPWNMSDAQRQNERVNKVLKNLAVQ